MYNNNFYVSVLVMDGSLRLDVVWITLGLLKENLYLVIVI